MTLKTGAMNALVNIYDALNGDDDDTKFDLCVVEEYIEQLEAELKALRPTAPKN